MQKSFGQTATWIAAIVVLSQLGCNAQTRLFEHKATLTVAQVDDAPLDVVTTNGFIAATQTDRAEVQIFATIRAETQGRANVTEVVAERGAANALVIRVAWPEGGPRSSEGCDIDVHIPNADGVKLENDNGELRVTGLAGNAELASTNGAIHVDRHTGPIAVQATNGQIAIHDATDSVEANATNGQLTVALAPDSTGPVHLATTNGMIQLNVGPAFAGLLSIDTVLGAIDVGPTVPAKQIEDAKHHVVLEFGAKAGEPTVESSISTTNGMIQIGTVSAEKRVN